MNWGRWNTFDPSSKFFQQTKHNCLIDDSLPVDERACCCVQLENSAQTIEVIPSHPIDKLRDAKVFGSIGVIGSLFSDDDV